MADNIERRIERIERKIGGISEGPRVIEIVLFGGNPLPPERTENGITYRYISFDSVLKKAVADENHTKQN